MTDRKSPYYSPLLSLGLVVQRVPSPRRAASILTLCTITACASVTYVTALSPAIGFAQNMPGRNAPGSAEARLLEAEKAFLHSLTAQSFSDSESFSDSPLGSANGKNVGAAKAAVQVKNPELDVATSPAKQEPTKQFVVKGQPATTTSSTGRVIARLGDEPAPTKSNVAERVPNIVKAAAVATKGDEVAFEAIAAVPADNKVGAKIGTKPVSAPQQAEAPTHASVKQNSGETEILKNSNANLRRELQSAQSKIEELQRSLDQARSQLALTETELTRLSARLDSKNRASLGKYNLPLGGSASQPTSVGSQAARASSEVTHPKPRVSEVKPPAANTEMPIATVSVDKADLRLGPGKNHSALMAVPRGSRLVVETRQGEWYRVFAPSGERAWIQSGMVLFGDGASLLNDGTAARVKGFNPNDEEEAFRRVQRMAAGQ